MTLANTLLLDPENLNRPKTNVIDAYGNTGFGTWLKQTGINTWYFLAGDINAGGTLGTAGFVSNGWYNLGWNGSADWYFFDSNGMMKSGWHQENGKTYYLNPNPLDTNYGKMVKGAKNIDGQVYIFDESGALIA